ncbi:MAG: recombination regulator RecX [Oscillatoriaceae bacterium SKW80]|nr:recombination regulator RecX [Oscillatoriaceae bacterium SKYG93]MCX8121808.1 recombination regulator RecX [Oscillatoriaceae bacterium SKW80]MDW8454568.1 regulatory protein RecX [Oscillatoriaceae cyanobacterium SKYGB_i_bin93]HIK27382.1 regulatory protein RecX [Oscillatoriaceae cyanobacterium M7585_C2015_266]
MSCQSYFMNLLARRDYSVSELCKKGEEKGFEPEEIQEALTYLQEQGYQSDRRLVENIILSCQKKYGKSVIKRKCFEKGISADIFEQVWAEYTPESECETGYLDVLKAKVMRKYKIDNFNKIDQKTKNKLYNYLRYRGFNPFEILRRWQNFE